MGRLTELEAQRARSAKTQSLFREVNERIEELHPPSSFIEFLCECWRRDCTEYVPLTTEEYEDVRSNADHFFVLPGHEESAVEEVVSRSPRYVVVGKLGVGAAVAEKLDPRQRQNEAT